MAGDVIVEAGRRRSFVCGGTGEVIVQAGSIRLLQEAVRKKLQVGYLAFAQCLVKGMEELREIDSYSIGNM